ncbi:hypothetical protein BBO99_00000763 [Phytophthora kernoviae]|uniref:RCK N-terminal domain-containing protein n=1 Tax=Phytophthora kernoviae TaxID=325452 RepID=A0A3R7JHP6_9STRA|nr:hypothetical protein BBI17_000673 [Phytophthora kernoviae]RLN85118.1 hypothetical protein BBO99_00000763 [Phytophthora kernoviae]
MWTPRYLDNGNVGAGIDTFMTVVSIVYAGTYITNTYIPLNSMPHSIWVIELICATLFAVDFATQGIYLNNRRQDFLLSVTALVNAVVILPLMCILLGAAGVIQVAETMDGTLSVKNLGDWTFFNSFFNSVMTFVTIDKPPSDNALSKIFVGVLVCVFILVIPYQISNVMDLSRSISSYEQASYRPTRNSRHVVLCGDLTASRIGHFFREIFHNDHDFVGVHVVVLSEDPPVTSLKALLLDPFFAKRVWFIQGSLLEVDDAKRAACDSADAIFILTSRVDVEGEGANEKIAKRNTPAKKLPTTAEEAVVDDVGNLNFIVDHIVVCVTTELAFATDLEHLIGPLRARSLKQYRPVVIMTAKLPDDDIYESFSHFLDVHFVVGDPYRRKTLRRAGVSDAFRVLILGTSCLISDNNSELLQDAESVALHRFITSFIGMPHAPRVITELGNRASVHFVAQNLLGNGWFQSSGDDNELAMFESSEAFSQNFFLSPAFASGLTYSSTLCDSLLINQFFNGRIKAILGEFMFASQTSHDTNTLRDAMLEANLQRSSLFAVEVPLDFVGRSFEYVFHYLLSSDDILVIGLYRCHPYMHPSSEKPEYKARVEFPENERSVPYGYVYVNPQPFEEITGDDLLYVLSDKQPCWANSPEE